MTTRDIALTALFAALTAALGVLPVLSIMTAPVVAQNFGLMLSGGVLGWRRGGLAQLLFLALVAGGAPLLSGGRGGFAPFVGPWGGFLLAWPVAACLVGALTQYWWSRLTMPRAVAATILGGVLSVYLIGLPWMMWKMDITLIPALLTIAVFVPGDLAKAVLAGVVILMIKRAYPVIDNGR